MKLRNVRRITACAVTCSMLLGQIAFATNIIEEYKWETEIAEGAVYTDVVGVSSAGNQNIRYIEYTPNSSVLPMVGYGDKIYSKDTIIEIARDIEGDGTQVLAGVNGDYYVVSTGVPLGLVMNDGVIVSSDAWQQAIGFREDGTAVIGEPTFGLHLTNGVSYVTVDHLNKTRTTSGVYMYDHNFDDQTNLSADGINIKFEKIDGGELTPGGTIKLRVLDIYETNQSEPLLENQMILAISNGGPVERLPEFTVGEEVTLEVISRNAEWNDVKYAIGGRELLIDNGVVNNNGNTKQPRTAVGVKANGEVVFIEVDGRGVGGSSGIGLNDLADYMLSLGCVDAINLDGGGSSTIVTQLPGDSLLSVMNNPSDGSLRSSSNFIYLVNNTQPTGVIDSLHIYPETYTLLKNASIDLSVKATDANAYSMTPPSDVTYSVESGGATIEDNVLTATSQGVVTVNASGGGVSGTEQITVLSKVEDITVRNDETDKAVSSLSLGTNDVYDFTATASYRDKDVASVDNSFTWTVEGDIGTIDEYGVFTAASKPSSGKVVASYGNEKTSISVSIGLSLPTEVTILEDFEDGISGLSVSQNGNLSVSNDIANVLYGKTNAVFLADSSDSPVLISNSGVYIAPEFNTIGMFVKTDETPSIRINITDAAGVPEQLTLTAGQEHNGYTYYSSKLPEYAVNYVGFDISGAEDEVLIDNISALITEEYDTTSPLIVAEQSAVSIANGQSSALTYKVTDEDGMVVLAPESLDVYVDGDKTTNYTYDSKTGTVSIKLTAAPLPVVPEPEETEGEGTATASETSNSAASTISDPEGDPETGNTEEQPVQPVDPVDPIDPVKLTIPTTSQSALSDGLHIVTVTGTDYSGNISTVSTEINVGAHGFEYFADTSSNWSEPYANFVAQRGIIKGEEINGQNYFSPTRNLTRAEFAVIMARYLGLAAPTDMELPLSDISEIPSWALDSVKAVYANGIMTGSLDTATGEMSFNPTDNITRAEVMTVVGKSLEKGYETEEITATDFADIPSWSLSYVETLVSLGYVGGYPDGTILPLNNITRGEIAKILYTLH